MQRFTFSGTEVLLGMLLLCLLTGVGIYLLRRRLERAPDRTVASKSRTVDVFALSPAVHRYSLCAALLLAFLSLNWTKYNPQEVYYAPVLMEEDIIENVPPTIHRPPTPPPPPPPPVIEPVVEPEAASVQLIDQSILEDEPVVFEAPAVPVRKATPPPPPTAPPPPPEDNSPFIFVERMPVFGKACQELTGEEKKQCSDRTLLQFVQGKVRYPRIARTNGIEGTVVVRFVVEVDGSVSSVEAVRKISGGCTEEAIRAVESINESAENFAPGIQGGRPVRVIFNLPVKFELQR